MCYDDKAHPPAPPRVTGLATGADVLLGTSDGTEFTVYLATPEHPAGTAAVLLPDARGLDPFYRELALLFAQTGTATLVIDFFGRSAGTQPRAADFDSEPHLQQLRRDTMLRDLAAGISYLHGRAASPVFAIGFCMGGGTALLAATTELPLAGVIAFYPWTGELGQDPALPHDFAETIRCPVLGLFGGADRVIPVTVPRALDDHMTRARVPHQIVIYVGEPHGFFEHHHMGQDGHQAAANDAWKQLLTFLDTHAQPSQ